MTRVHFLLLLSLLPASSENLAAEEKIIEIVPIEVTPGPDEPTFHVDWEVEDFSSSEPSVLRFSCATSSNRKEEACADELADYSSAHRLEAARLLWRGHSRRHTTRVLMYLAEPPHGGNEYRAFQREVESSLQPESILREFRDGDYEWAAWLAFLRPHEELVPTLLVAVKEKPEMLPETTLALGNSGDLRAFEPLVELLKSEDYRTAGDAAKALGFLGDPKAESLLIEALEKDNGWLQVNACQSLGVIGTVRALPPLEKLSKDDRYTGALGIKRMAAGAIESIKKREERREKKENNAGFTDANQEA